jgi:hypothetical protein
VERWERSIGLLQSITSLSCLYGENTMKELPSLNTHSPQVFAGSASKPTPLPFLSQGGVPPHGYSISSLSLLARNRPSPDDTHAHCRVWKNGTFPQTLSGFPSHRARTWQYFDAFQSVEQILKEEHFDICGLKGSIRSMPCLSTCVRKTAQKDWLTTIYTGR